MVDDDPRVLQLMVAILSNDYNVLAASNGASALSICAAHKGSIAAAVLDWKMPVMCGLELARRLRELTGDIKIVLVSGNNPDPQEQGVPPEYDYFVPKPFTPAKLKEAVARVMDSHPSSLAASGQV